MIYDPKCQESRLALANAIENYFDFSSWTIKEDRERGTMERVYSFQLKSYEKTIPVRVKIYTSIDLRSGECRTVGADAIRICAVRRYDDGSVRGFMKHRRINRTGQIQSIIKRMDSKIRAIQSDAVKKWSNPVFCSSCGAPTFVSKSGRDVCSKLCWTKSKATKRRKYKKT